MLHICVYVCIYVKCPLNIEMLYHTCVELIHTTISIVWLGCAAALQEAEEVTTDGPRLKPMGCWNSGLY